MRRPRHGRFFRRACSAGLALLAALTCADAAAQLPQPSTSPAAGRAPALLSTGVHYQRYMLDDDRHIQEISFPVYVQVPFGAATSMSLRTSPATVQGRGLESVSGLSDAQLSFSHLRHIGDGSVVLSLGANLPSGRRTLTQEEFETTVELGHNFYDFRTPAFGQGFNVSPGVTLAYPVGENVVVGGGATYQYKGAFEPVENMDDDYRPGAEVLITGGLDIRIAAATALSGDVTYTLYGADEIGSEAVFESGDQLVATIQFLKYRQFDELRIVARFRNRDRGSIVAPGVDAPEAVQALPNQMDLLTSYRMRTRSSTSIGLHGGLHHFGETDIHDSKVVVSLGASPQTSVLDQLDLWTRFSVRAGDVLGVEAAMGLAVTL